MQGASVLQGSSDVWHFPATFSEAHPPTSRLLSLIPHSCHLQAASLSAASQPSSSLKLGLFPHPTSVFTLLHFTSTFTTPPLCLPPTHILTPARRASSSTSHPKTHPKCHPAGHSDLLGPNPHPPEVPVAPDPAEHTLSKCSAPLPWAGLLLLQPLSSSSPQMAPLSPCSPVQFPWRHYVDISTSIFSL